MIEDFGHHPAVYHIHAKWRFKDATAAPQGYAYRPQIPRGNVFLAFSAILDTGDLPAAYRFVEGEVPDLY